MIIVILKGGLGNQLYQYASAKALAEKNRSSIWLDLSFLNRNIEGVTKRRFELYKFELKKCRNVKIFDIDDLAFNRRFINKCILNINKKITYKYEENSLNFNDDFFKISSNVVIDGYFQSYKYFNFIRNKLIDDFKITESLNKENLDALSSILSYNSVSIHVRRGDYVTLKNANEFHGLCDLKYYESSMDIIKSKVENPHFFIFSDDIDWCKDNFKETKISFVDINDSNNAHLDLNLMKNCKHFIIANSSFSWWAAWLAENKDKIIIAPKKWFAEKNINIEDRIPAEWIVI